jgi:hypothetical protein
MLADLDITEELLDSQGKLLISDQEVKFTNYDCMGSMNFIK